MIAVALSLILSFTPSVGWAPLKLLTTIRLNQPALGVVCLQLESVDDSSDLLFRESCEDINGSVKQIRWIMLPAGEYRLRATFRGGTERIVSAYKTLRILQYIQ